MHFEMASSPSGTADGPAGSASYRLKILNENSAFQHFALFQAIPVNPALPGPLTSLVWMTGTVAPGSATNPGQGLFLWENNLSAITGYIHDLGTVTNPRQVIVFSDMNVGTDGDNELAITYLGQFPNGAPAFPDPPTDGAKATITLKTDGTIPTPTQTAAWNMTVNAGIGMSAFPTVVAQIGPNRTYPFSITPSYHIVAAATVMGQVVDQSLESRAFPVTFPPGGKFLTLAFTEQNQFKVV